MDACADAWGHVAAFLLPIDIASLSNARKATRACVRRVLARVLCARLAALLPASLGPVWPPGLRLSGSACWHAMAGEGWRPCNLDLVCPIGQVRAAQVWLEQAGFFVQSVLHSSYVRNARGIVNFCRWPDGVRRVAVNVHYAGTFTEIGLDMEGRTWPESVYSLRHQIQLAILQPDGALNVDLPILLNSYDGKAFVVQRPDLVAARACEMTIPCVCIAHDDEVHWERVRAFGRLRKYSCRGVTIQRRELPCPVCAAGARKRKAGADDDRSTASEPRRNQ